jgi:mono/diheme cytochrome c family protein
MQPRSRENTTKIPFSCLRGFVVEDVIRDRVALTPPVTPAKSDYKNDPVRRGEYLARIGVCANCHTPVDAEDHRMVSYRFGGGRAEGGIASNITPDPSGIAHYDENLFIQTMRTGKVGGVRELKGAMTWWYLGHLTDDDLRAIFAYLKTVPPVKHRVSTSEEETLCPICGRKHGFGDLNAPGPVHPVMRTTQDLEQGVALVGPKEDHRPPFLGYRSV